MPDLFRLPTPALSLSACRRFAGALVCYAAAALFMPLPDVRAAEPVDLELVLAVDVSGSIDPTEARLQREGYQRALANPEVIAAISSGPLGKIALSYVEWAGMGHYKVIVDWQVVDGPESANSFVEQLSRVEIQRAHRTSLSDAITFSAKHLNANAFEGTRQIVDISGDGANNFGRLVVEARDEAVAQGVIINGLPIITQSATAGTYPSIPNLDLFFRDCVIGGPGAFYVTAHGFEDFARAVKKKLILEIADLAPRTTHRADAGTDGLATLWLAQSGPAEPREAPPCNIGEWRWMSIIQGGTSDR
jgi:hypothetical protein